MGNEASRFCRLANFTRIQKFRGNSATVNHIKSSSFTGAVPAGHNGTSSTSSAGASLPAAVEDSDSVPLAQSAQQPPPPPAAAAAAAAAGGEARAEVGSQPPRSPDDAEAPVAADKLFPGRQLTQDDPDFHTSQEHRGVIQDGETKKMQREDTGGRNSWKGRDSGRETAGGTVQRLSGKLIGSASSKPLIQTDSLGKPVQAVGKPFPKRPMTCKLSAKTWTKLEELFRLMDQDGSNAVTKDEAKQFFQGAFSNLSVDAMFNEVDVDGSGAITAEEFVKFWLQVRGSGYKEQDILDELGELIEGGAWVDWMDGRDTAVQAVTFPKRPLLCRLSQKTWSRCEELFHKMSGNDDKMFITREKAQAFFKGAFCNISADAMFNEIDVNHHGMITPKEFMNFWVQVKASGYKEKDILEEIDNLCEGSPWVDWKDGRKT